MKSTIYARVSSEWNRGLPRKVRTSVALGLSSFGNLIADVAEAIAPKDESEPKDQDRS